MSGSDDRLLRVAVALLPRASRDRYREQWQGELRDAASLGIRESEIAHGALAFAARVNRPFPSWVRTTPPRLSFALALSAAVVSLSQFASLIPVSDGFTTTISGSVASTPLISWVALVPAFSFLMVMAARRASARERRAVTLLAIASYLPFLRDPIDSLYPWQGGTWLTLGSYAYAASGILLLVALILGWRTRAWQNPRHVRRVPRLIRSGAAGLVVGGVVALCSLNESATWESRKLSVWVEPLTDANRAEYAQWLTGWAFGESLTTNVLSGWLIVGMLVAVAVSLFGLSRRATLGRTIALAAGAVSLALVTWGGTLMFLQIVSETAVVTVPVDAVMFVGRLGLLVVVVLAASRGVKHDELALPSERTLTPA